MGREKEMSAFPASCYLVLFMDAELTIHWKFTNIWVVFWLTITTAYSLEAPHDAALYHRQFSMVLGDFSTKYSTLWCCLTLFFFKPSQAAGLMTYCSTGGIAVWGRFWLSWLLQCTHHTWVIWPKAEGLEYNQLRNYNCKFGKKVLQSVKLCCCIINSCLYWCCHSWHVKLNMHDLCLKSVFWEEEDVLLNRGA